MPRYRKYDLRHSIATLITIEDSGCTVETRYAGHSSGVHRLSMEAAERSVERYGFVEVDESIGD